MAALRGNDGVPGFMQQQQSRDSENRRVLRTRSSTTSFSQYRNKPNRVAIRRNEHLDSDSSTRDVSSSGGSSDGVARAEKRSVIRAKSTSAMTPIRKLDPREVPAQQESDSKHEDIPPLKAEEARRKKKKKKEQMMDDNIASEDSDVESVEGGSFTSPRKPPRRRPKKSQSLPVHRSTPKSTDKRDMLLKNNRCLLHSMMYDVRMGIDMKDLFDEVQRGEIPRPAIKSLMMPSP